MTAVPRHLWWDRPVSWLLEALVIGEADGEPLLGQRAVVWVVRNRVQCPGWWGSGWAGVMLMPHQFSCFWTDFEQLRIRMGRRAPRPTLVAAAVLSDPPLCEDPTHGATHYCNRSQASPPWADMLPCTARIGRHTFYREAT